MVDIKPIYLNKGYLFQNKIYYLDKIYLCFAKIKFSKHTLYRSSRPEVFCKKVVLRNFESSQENAYTRVSFLIKLEAWTLQLYLKKDSNTFCLLFTGIYFSLALFQAFRFLRPVKRPRIVYDHQAYFRCSFCTYIYIYSYSLPFLIYTYLLILIYTSLSILVFFLYY